MSLRVEQPTHEHGETAPAVRKQERAIADRVAEPTTHQVGMPRRWSRGTGTSRSLEPLSRSCRTDWIVSEGLPSRATANRLRFA